MEPKELRSLLEETLTGLLGTYTFANRRKASAIAVIQSYEVYPPPGTDIQGLEVIIYCPTGTPQATLNGYRVENNWSIHLKAWDKKSLQPALHRLLALDQLHIKQTIPIAANEILGIPEMMTLTINEFVRVGQ